MSAPEVLMLLKSIWCPELILPLSGKLAEHFKIYLNALLYMVLLWYQLQLRLLIWARLEI